MMVGRWWGEGMAEMMMVVVERMDGKAVGAVSKDTRRGKGLEKQVRDELAFYIRGRAGKGA
jgi:hypothetical protein